MECLYLAAASIGSCPPRLTGPLSGRGKGAFTPCENRSAPCLSHKYRKATCGVLARWARAPDPKEPALLLPLTYTTRLRRFADPPVLHIVTVVDKATALSWDKNALAKYAPGATKTPTAGGVRATSRRATTNTPATAKRGDAC